MQWLKRNIRYFILSLFVLTNAVIISESALSGGPSGTRSSFISLLLSVFVNRTVPPVEHKFVELETITVVDHEVEPVTKDMTYYIPLGITRRFSVSFTPEDTTDKSLTWTSSNSEVLSVYSGGYLEARALGENVIVTVTPSNPSAAISFYVTVHENLAPSSFTANLEKDSIDVGTTTRLVVPQTDRERREFDITKLDYYSDDETIATINKYGVIKGISEGVTTIGIMGYDETFTLNVSAPTTPIIYPSVINLELPETGLVYDKIPLNYHFDVENVTDPSLTFVSSNEAIARVIKEDDKLFVEGTKVNGSATITAYLNTDFSVFATHPITMNNVLATSLTLSTTKPDVGVGQKLIIETLLNHGISGKENVPVTNERVTFSSSDPLIARVSTSGLNGVVLGLKEGVVTITGKSDSNPEVQSSITVRVIPTPFINDSNFDDFQGFIRKALGHYFLFFVDGIFGFWTFFLFLKDKKLKWTIIISLGVGLFMASLSEIIQTFIPLRAGRFSDVVIDFAGYLTATLLCYLILYLLKRKASKKDARN